MKERDYPHTTPPRFARRRIPRTHSQLMNTWREKVFSLLLLQERLQALMCYTLVSIKFNKLNFMKVKFFYKVILPILVLLLICTCSSCSSSKDAELASYREYYDATEQLLDELEVVHNWCDDVGEGDIAIEYYNVKSNILKLQKQ